MKTVDVTIISLQTMSPGEVGRRLDFPSPFVLLHVTACPPYFYRDLYRGVGRRYNWYSRYHWADAQFVDRLKNPAVSLHVLYDSFGPAGYFELVKEPADDSVEIIHLGLLPSHYGRGLGKPLVSAALHGAWSLRPSRVWLHTCTKDHAAAMPTYLSQGLRAYKVEQVTEPLLDLGGES